MTRGQIVVFHEGGITTSTEFNGDMYFNAGDGWGGHGDEVVEALKKVKSVEDYKEYVRAFNKEYFQYEEELFYNAITDGGYGFTEKDMLDMTEGYYDKWFSDYLYFKNLRDEDVDLITMDGTMLTVKPNGILALNFGDFTDECEKHSEGVVVGLSEKVIEICEDLDWTVHIYDDEDCVELEKYLPEGEDFIATVEKNNFVKEVEEYADNFDPDEHAEMWVESRGTRGVPLSIRALIDDADAIKAMLLELANALKNGGKKE